MVEALFSTTAPPDVLDRLLVRGYDAWLAGRFDAAAMEPDPEPLPGW